MDSLLGCSVHGILQARFLEWVAISVNACVKFHWLSDHSTGEACGQPLDSPRERKAQQGYLLSLSQVKRFLESEERGEFEGLWAELVESMDLARESRSHFTRFGFRCPLLCVLSHLSPNWKKRLQGLDLKDFLKRIVYRGVCRSRGTNRRLELLRTSDSGRLLTILDLEIKAGAGEAQGVAMAGGTLVEGWSHYPETMWDGRGRRWDVSTLLLLFRLLLGLHWAQPHGEPGNKGPVEPASCSSEGRGWTGGRRKASAHVSFGDWLSLNREWLLIMSFILHAPTLVYYTPDVSWLRFMASVCFSATLWPTLL